MCPCCKFWEGLTDHMRQRFEDQRQPRTASGERREPGYYVDTDDWSVSVRPHGLTDDEVRDAFDRIRDRIRKGGSRPGHKNRG
jgi:hypothetical protein